MNEKIHDYIYSKKDEILRELAELIAIPSVKGDEMPDAPFGEEPKKALLKMKELCEAAGFSTAVYGGAVLSADYTPDGGEPGLGILAHLDVVPVQKENWNTEPFQLTEKNGVVYGRGVIDDKGPAVAALWALKCVKELGLPLKKGVRLIFGTDEENGSEDLEIYKKYERFPENVFTPDGSFPVINIEKGMLRSRFTGRVDGDIISFEGGNIPNAVPDKASAVLKNVLLGDIALVRETSAPENLRADASPNGGGVSIVSNGKSAHASTPESGINAVTELISVLNKVTKSEVLRGLERLFPFGETDGAALGLKCSDASGALTCVLSKLSIKNGECEGVVDIRFPTCTDLETVRKKLRGALESIGLEYAMILGDEPHVVPADSEFVQKLLRVYEDVEGEKGKCIAIGGGTYVHNIDGGVAFGAERGDTDYHMHGDDEFVTVDELLRDAVLFAHAIAEF